MVDVEPVLKIEDASAPEDGARIDRLLPSWRAMLLLAAAWLVPTIVLTSRGNLTNGQLDAAAWARDFGQNLWYWLFWAAVTPLIYRLYARFHFARGRFCYVLPIHMLAAAATAAAVAIAAASMRTFVFLHDGSFGHWLAHELFSPSARGLHGLHIGKYFLVLGVMALIFESRLRQRTERAADAMRLRASQLEAQLASATLASLRGRLQPHFLFNALNSVGALVEAGENDRAFRMIGVLGGLLRRVLEPTGERRIPLAEELDLVRRYLAVEGLRFGDRLVADIDVPVAAEGARVPPLVLQPLVENAVRHAVARVSRPVVIIVRATASADRLRIEVVDDGPGLAAGWCLEADAGVGLSTTAERLRLLYGDAAALRVEPAGDVASASNRAGVRSIIEIPVDTTGGDEHVASAG